MKNLLVFIALILLTSCSEEALHEGEKLFDLRGNAYILNQYSNGHAKTEAYTLKKVSVDPKDLATLVYPLVVAEVNFRGNELLVLVKDATDQPFWFKDPNNISYIVGDTLR